MIAFIKGKLISKTANEVIIDSNGIGYQIYISFNTSQQLTLINEELNLYTYLAVKEDAMELFGFYELREKEAFLQLIKVSKIGPKTAIGILSTINPDELVELIVSSNHTALSKLPGIGPKTAERIVVELRDKFKNYSFNRDITQSFVKSDSITEEAVLALISLGYNKQKAEKSVDIAIKIIGKNTIDLENVIKTALKNAIS